MTTKALQMFSDEYLAYAKQLTPRQIVDFLEDFRQIAAAGQPQKSKLISMKVPLDLLNAFKTHAKLTGRPYQSLIKDLMREHLTNLSFRPHREADPLAPNGFKR